MQFLPPSLYNTYHLQCSVVELHSAKTLAFPIESDTRFNVASANSQVHNAVRRVMTRLNRLTRIAGIFKFGATRYKGMQGAYYEVVSGDGESRACYIQE